MKLWDKIKSNYNRPLVRAVLVIAGACAVGTTFSLGAAGAVAAGAFVYGVGTEIISRKNKAMKEIAQKNGGRPLTSDQKTAAYCRALVDTLGIGNYVSVAVPKVQDVKTAKDGAWAKVNKNKTKQAPTAVPQAKVKTNAFDFNGFMPNQGGRKF